MRAAADDAFLPRRRPWCPTTTIVPLLLILGIFPRANVTTAIRTGNKMTSYKLSVMLICDETSEAHCSANITHTGLSEFTSSNAGHHKGYRNGCEKLNTSCNHSVNNTQPFPFEYHLDKDRVIVTKTLSETKSVQFNMSHHVIGGSVRDRISSIDTLVSTDSADVIVAIGDSMTVQTAATVAEGYRIPILGYNTQHGDGPKGVQGETYVHMNPSPEAQGRALTQIIGQLNMKQATVIIENSRYADGFLNGVRQTVKVRKQDIFNILPLDANIGTSALRHKLIDLSNRGWKIIILHCSPDLMLRVVTVAMSTRLYNSGYAWFLSEMAFSRDLDVIAQLPDGLLAIDSFWLGGVTDVIHKATSYIISAATCVLEVESPKSTKPRFRTMMNERSNNRSEATEKADLQRNVFISIRLRNSNDFLYSFQRCLRDQINGSASGNTGARVHAAKEEQTTATPGKSKDYEGVSQGSVKNTGPAYYLLNTVDDGVGDRNWAKLGYITATGQGDLKNVLWPGHNVYAPASDAVKTYRVVTRPAEPFVFISAQASGRGECGASVPCLQVQNSSKSLLATIVDDFESDMKYIDVLYTVHCCQGLALDVLRALASDLNFRFVIYFTNDTNYGTLVSNNWTGMVGDIVNGVTDIIAGAFSVTTERMNLMSFTEPFFPNTLSVVVTAEADSLVSIWAFLSPFSRQVWLCIFLSSLVAGVATSFLEWHSPFGLNPHGRKRSKNYSLGSGLLMVIVLLTGHTINIKAPKSWPGKVIQNVWAGLAIFIMTSYTANLAAHLAGQSAVTSMESVYDTDFLAKRVAVVSTSAVESFVEKATPKLSRRGKMSYVDSTLTGINMLRDHMIDVYLDDTALLEYGLTKYDNGCKIRLAGPGKEFGSEGYAFGLPRQSWLQIPMSNQILLYTESGFIQELASKYISRPQCQDILAGSAHPYGLEHTGGLFIIMVSAVFISVLFLVLEHVAYRYLVPWLRKQPSESFWKTENLAFISQRVFRVVKSEKLYSQKQAAQEMITIVKQRDFTRLIQKHELQKRRAATQKRVKTKAEVFQDITENIVSYHRQLQSAPDTAENSEAEGEAYERDNLDLSSLGVHNDAHDDDHFDLALSKIFGKESMRLKNNGADEEDENNSDSASRVDGKKVNRTGRDFASWEAAAKHMEDSSFRKRPESYTLYSGHRSSKKADDSLSYRRSWGGTNNKALTIAQSKVDESSKKLGKRFSEVIFPDEWCGFSELSSNTGISSMSVNPMSPAFSKFSEFPPSNLDNSYYFSSTSSSFQSPSDEQREFSPLNTPSSANTDDFSGCDDSFDGVSTLSAGSSDSLASQLSNFRDNDSQDNESQTSNDPLLQCHKSLETLQEHSNLRASGSDRLTNLSNKNEQPSRCLKKRKLHSHKTLPRSRSAESFSFQSLPKNGADDSENKFGGTNRASVDHTVVGVYVGGQIPLLPALKSNNGTSTTSSFKQNSDLAHSKSPHPHSQQQNNARRAGSYDSHARNYFTTNIKLKDNRVKSTLRRQAMSGYRSQLSADFVDDYTLDALSKEDLLLLWKKAEIELESRLQEVLARNRRLSLAIGYLNKRDRSGDPEQV